MILDFSKPIEGNTDSGPDISDASGDAPVDGQIVLPTCGDGLIEAPETCDDENLTDLDGCSATCTEEAGYDCANEPSSCTLQGICPTVSIVSSGMPLDSCLSYFNAGHRASGKYRIAPGGAAMQGNFDVICDMETAGGGWTVVVNNVADQIEPEGCLPRLAPVDSFVCGTVSCADDFAVPVYGLPFTELAWAVHDGSFALGPHNLFRWTSATTLPNQNTWSSVPQESGQKLAGLEAQPLIECVSATLPNGLKRVGNDNVRTATNGFLTTDVVTVFDIDTSAATTGNMSLTDVDSAGLDDFQDGGGCSDLWNPFASRGAATLIMIR